ncbi:Ferredoxin, 2Fe-2S [compost metagenome]
MFFEKSMTATTPKRRRGRVAEDEIQSKPEWSQIPEHTRHVMLCTGPRCVQRGALPLWKVLRRELLVANRIETTDGVLLTRSHCQFPCNLGPVLTVYPDRCWYRVANAEDAQRLVREHLIEGQPVPDLLLNGQVS